jgi:hypothetical protein
VAGVFAIRLKDEMKASFPPKRLDDGIAHSVVAQAMTVLACGGYMLKYRSVELRIRYVGLGGA